MDVNKRVNVMYNMVREIAKMEDVDAAAGELRNIVLLFFNAGLKSEGMYKDPEFAKAANFAGYSVIALIVGALGEETDPKRILSLVNTVATMTAEAITKREADCGKEEKEA